MTVYDSPAAFSEALAGFVRQLGRVQADGLRRGLSTAREEALRAFQGRGIGRTLFRTDRGQGERLVTLEDVKATEGGAEGGIKLSGLAALQEAGGRTKAHTIAPKRTTVLRFAEGGSILFRSTVRHPGSRVQGVPFAEPALLRAEPAMASDMDAALQSAADRMLG